MQLDGGVRAAGRGRGAVRHRACDRRASCARARHRVPVGKDSLSMKTAWHEAGELKEGRRAGVAREFGVCAGRGRSPYADSATAPGSRADAVAADRPGRRSQPIGRFDASRRFMAASAMSRQIVRSRCNCALSSARSATCAVPVCCSPITIVPTVASSRPSSRWPSPDTADSACVSTAGDDRSRPTVADLFAEELGAVVQVEASHLDQVRGGLPRRALAIACAS